MTTNPPQLPQQSMPVSDAVLRRRSADVGGLYLALRDSNHGLGWLDSSTPSDPDIKISTKHAVLLSTMHTETLRLLESSAVQNDPPELSQEDRVRLLKSIESWYFEPLRMPEHEVLACVIFLFQVLFRIEGMQEAVNINFNIIPRFILHIRQLYRWQNHYHNFEHAVDVLQAIHCYLRAAGVVPPVSLLLDVDVPSGNGMWSSTREHDSEPLITCLTPREIFALYLAAIGHDVAHPGFNNPFMENAEAPLSQVYENGSALEQMHSYMLLKTMRYHGLGVLLDDPETGQHFRRILRGSVLATDMGVHNDFMNKFAKLLETWTGTVDWQAAKFERQEFICKLLLKNADISNPSRPFLVSKQWASALQQEWACQYKFENYLELTHSVNPSNGPLAEANSQVFFTGKIAKPLVDMTAVAIPELRLYSYHCAENLREWEQILKSLKEAPPSTAMTSLSKISTPPLAPPLSPPHSPSTPASSPRQNSTIVTPNYPTFTTSSLRSQTTSTTTTTSPPSLSQSQSQTPPLFISTPVLSPGAAIIIPTTTTPSSSSSNPVSPRTLNPTSDNDYSGVFRLTRPKGSSSSTTSPSATPSSGFGMSGSSGGAGGAGGGKAGQISRTPSSNEGGGSGGGLGGFPDGNNGASSVVAGANEILPSLSRAAARVIAGTPSRTTGAGIVGLGGGTTSVSSTTTGGVSWEGGGGGSVTLLPSAVEPPKQFLPRSLMYPHPIKYVRQPLQQYQHPQQQQDSELEQYQPSQSPPLPPPQPQPLSNTPSSSSFPFQSDESEFVLGTPGSSETEGVGGGMGMGRGGNDNEDTVFEREVELRHQGFKRAVERGIGVGSLKKRKSGNILSVTPPSGSGVSTTTTTTPSYGSALAPPSPPLPTSNMSTFSFDFSNVSTLPPPPLFGGGGSTTGYHQSRASWCSGEPIHINLGTVEDAKGTIEGWRGRWGSANLGGGGGESWNGGGVGVGGASRAVASSEEGSGADDDSEDGEGEGRKEGRRGVEDGGKREGEGGCSESEDSKEEEEEEEGEEEMNTSSIPAGLVSAAPIAKCSDQTSSNLNPQTPPRQTDNQDSSFTITDEYRSGSPTPKAKAKMKMKMRESEAQRKRREEEEEERRRKLREELIRESEKEQERKVGGAGSGGKRSMTKSRSRSKLRRRTKGKK